ncbi:unnamed protein product (macronuclear) [Paramecium tetraurelia]|uniref:EGF-like domain-containing protein n=1 Tax=Paramecium tetraurelia TaxID=5888 RepID=A0CG78_PARTE|nr:uncharacterized protein GSPATT00038240001 [Paramecium tetraurelia]CAK69795.1 unnamed protein product [Paramecium tetraurelia]|eukprot:XP_001437192.1 hypothetical protein (macronuclear) [Paramecium tetraurelia strain d4-2]
MFLLLVIWGIAASSLLKNTNSLYEEWRHKAQALVTRTPMEMIRQTLGLRSLDSDDEEQFIIPETNGDLKHSRVVRMMEEKGTPNPPVPVVNNTINEYLRQGPLIPLKCYLGQPILINVTQHYCFKQKVTYLQYQDISVKNSANCTIRYRLHYGCLCPPDFYGDYCKNWNPIVCEIEQPSKNCKLVVDEDYYNKKIDGNPPCNQFRSSQFVDNVRTVCYNYYQNLLNTSVFYPEENYTIIWSNYTKGISALLPQQYKYSAPIPEDPNDPQQYIQFATASEEAEKEYFKYEQKACTGVESNTLCSSLLFNINPYVRFINWTYLSESDTTYIDYDLTLVEMLGQNYFQVPIKVTKSTPLFGRYSLEIGFILHLYGYNELYATNGSNVTAQNSSKEYQPQLQPKILFFEDQLYEEPASSIKQLEGKARAGLIIAIVILLIAILLIYKYRNTLTECCFPRIDKVVPEKYDNQKGCCEKCFDCFKKDQGHRHHVAEPNSQHQNQSLE